MVISQLTGVWVTHIDEQVNTLSHTFVHLQQPVVIYDNSVVEITNNLLELLLFKAYFFKLTVCNDLQIALHWQQLLLSQCEVSVHVT